MLTLAMFGTLVSASSAVAGPAEACATFAETGNPGLVINISLGVTPLTSTSEVDVAADTIAANHSDPTLAVTFNAAGEQALRDFMSCLYAGNRFTLSSVWLEENVSTLSSFPNTVAVWESGTVQWFGELDTVYSTGSSHRLRFRSTSTASCVTAEVTTAFTDDFVGVSVASLFETCVESDNNPCYNYEECRIVSQSGPCLCVQTHGSSSLPASMQTCRRYSPFSIVNHPISLVNLILP